MLTAFYDEELIELGGIKLTLAIDFRALDLIEGSVGGEGGVTPMPEIFAMLFADPPPLRALGKTLYALLRRHHESITQDEAAGVIFGQYRDRVTAAMYALLLRAMNLDGSKAKDENPRERRGALQLS